MSCFLGTLLFLFIAVTAAIGKPVTLSPEKTIVLSGPIGENTYLPMLNALNELEKEKQVDLIISSPGGSVAVGSLIIDRMEQLKERGVTFRCVVRDLAASMAFQILLHCNERYATPKAFLLWHPVRVFYQGVVVAPLAEVLMVQLRLADEVAVSDLMKHLPMPEKELMWHYNNETLHHAISLHKMAPSFFDKVTNDIVNLWPEKVVLNTAPLVTPFNYNQIVYIHERFLGEDKP